MKQIKVLMILLIVILLSACSSINEVDEEKVKDVSNKITEAIVNSVGKEKASRHETKSIDASNLDTLKINSTVGDIEIISHDSLEAVIDLSIGAKSSAIEKSERLVEEFTYSIEERMNSINIDTTYKKVDIEQNNITTDLIIKVPKNIENIVISLNVGEISIKNIDGKYEIENNVGNINIKNSTAYYDINTNVGEIELTDCTALKSSDFKTNTGNIELSFVDILSADKIKASADVGNIDLSIPNNSSYEAVINEFMQKERVISNKDKNTKISLKTGVGEIDLNEY